MKNRKSINNLLYKYAPMVAVDDVNRVEKKIENEHIFSEEHEKKMDKLFLAYERNIVNKKKVITFRKRVSQLVACVVVVVVVMASGVSAVVAAGNIKAYDMLHSAYPQMAEKLTPVQESCVSEGIELTVDAVNVHGDSAEICIAIKDLEGNRIDETTNLFDGYDIETSADQMGGDDYISYDEETKAATYLIWVKNINGEKIDGEKLKFSMNNLLLQKKNTTIELDSLSDIPFCEGTQEIADNCIREEEIWGKYEKIDDYYVLKPNGDNALEPVNKIKLLGYGFVDGRLHVKTVCDGWQECGNRVSLYLKKGDKITDPKMCIGYDDENGVRCREYIFDVYESEIDNYKLCGNVVTYETNLAGDWNVSIVVK